MSGCQLLQFVLCFATATAINDYVGDNKTFWQSTSTFTRQHLSTSSQYGAISYANALKMELTVVWNGRSATNNDDAQYYNSFFEIIGPSDVDTSHDDHNKHASTYYPSLYLQPTRDAFHVCIFNQHYNLNHPTLIIGHSYAFVIEFNASTLALSIDDEQVIEIDCSALLSDEHTDDQASIYWFRSESSRPYVIAGDANISDIRIVSHVKDASDSLSSSDDEYTFGWVIYSLFALPALCLFAFCCYKSRQIRQQMEKTIIEQRKNNHESTTIAIQHEEEKDEDEDDERQHQAEFAEHFAQDDDDTSLSSHVQPLRTQSKAMNIQKAQKFPDIPVPYMSESPMRTNMGNALRLATEHSYNSYGPGHAVHHRHRQASASDSEHDHRHHGSYGHRKSPYHVLPHSQPPDPRVFSAATSVATSELFASPRAASVGGVHKKSQFNPLPASTPDSTSELFAPVKSPSAKRGVFDVAPYKHVDEMLIIQQYGEPSDRAPDLKDYEWISNTLKKREPRHHDQYLARFVEEGLTDAKIRSLRHFEKTLHKFKS